MCQGPEAVQKVREATRRRKLAFHVAEASPVEELSKLMDNADMIVSLGRGALEGMASGREVLVYDHRWYMKQPGVGDGLIRSENWPVFATHNFSGRASMKAFTVDDILNCFDEYNPFAAAENREIALEHFDVRRQAQKYLELIK
jgi:hypothetical protein